MTTTENKPAVETKQTATRPSFGNGRYSGEMERIYDELQKVFKLDATKAEKIARQAGADAGMVFQSVSATIRIGRASKDGKATIADASKAKGITLTNALNMVRALQWIDDAGKNGVSYGFTTWKLVEPLQKYIDDL